MAEGMWSASGHLPVVWGEAGTCFRTPPCYYAVPTPTQVRWYWDGWGRGLQGVFFFEAGAGDANCFKLFHADGSPKDCVPHLAGLAAAGRAFAGVMQGAQPVRPQVGMYFARATLIHDWASVGGFWGVPYHAWLSLYERGLTVERVVPETLDRLDSLRLLVVPGAAYLEAACVPALRAFCEAGGAVVAEGATGLRDEYARSPVPGLRELLGAADGGPVGNRTVELTADFAGQPKGHRIELRHTERVRAIKPAGAEVMARYGDGRAAIVRRRLGRGALIWLGFPTEALPDEPGPGWAEEAWGEVSRGHHRRDPLLPRLAVEAGVRSGVEIVRGDVNCSAVDTAHGRRVVFVSDPTASVQEVELRVAELEGWSVLDLLSGEPCGEGERCVFALGPGQVRLLAGAVSGAGP